MKIFIIIIALLLPVLITAKDFSIRVLCYHNVRTTPKNYFDVSAAEFEKQMRHLHEEGFISLKASEMAAALKSGETVLEKGKKYVVITFDDGNDGVYNIAVPIMKKYRMKATFYIYPSVIFAKERGMKNFQAYMRWDEIKDVLRSDLFELGCHSFYHPYLTKIDEYGLNHNIKRAKKVLIDKTGFIPYTFAYPFGSYNEKVVEHLKNSDFMGAFTVNEGSVEPGARRYELPRFMLFRNTKLEDFSRIVDGRDLNKIIAARNKKGKSKNPYLTKKESKKKIKKV